MTQKLDSELNNNALLYAGNAPVGLLVFSYPAGKRVGHLSLEAYGGLCSDANGDVFVTLPGQNRVFEYAHGGKKPINKVEISKPDNCSSDPTTGNLAVLESPPGGNILSIYKNARGSPKVYTFASGDDLVSCAYDDAGNLFLTVRTTLSNTLEELPSGSKKIVTIHLNQGISPFGNLQWDGRYLAIAGGFQGALKIYQVEVSGSAGSVVGTTPIDGVRQIGRMWIEGGYVVAAIIKGLHTTLGFWSYPSGGTPVKRVRDGDHFYFDGVTVSI
jgi:hypothetical protein